MSHKSLNFLRIVDKRDVCQSHGLFLHPSDPFYLSKYFMISVLISRRIIRLDYLYKLLYAVVEGGGYAAHEGGRGLGSCLQMKQFLVLHCICFFIVKAV